MATSRSRRLPALLLTALLSCFVALGASGAIAKSTHKHHGTKRHAKKHAKHHAKKHPGKHPAVKTPPGYPVAPPGPTLADLQRMEDTKLGGLGPAQGLTILDTGTPQQGSGTTERVGGNGVPSDTWIFPVHVSYYTTQTMTLLYGGSYIITTNTREKDNVLRDPTGTFTLRFVSQSNNCDPYPTACTPSIGGGA